LNLLGPGPAFYDVEKCNSTSRLRRSTSPTIGNAVKGSWIDIMAQRNESPGPGGLYPSHHFISK